jgi:CheY-like chemotaxis protein
VLADAVRLEQILVNLLTNAAKYAEPGGHVGVRAERRGAFVEIEVRDTGMGIAPPMLEQIWQLFHQTERTLDRSQGGLGIGLAIVRRLVEMHGGTAEARSGGPGQGSSFLVRLPIAPAEAPPEASACSPAEPATPRGAAHRLRVLVVDDNGDAASALGEVVQAVNSEHEVRVAGDGPSALEVAAELHPDLVFLDIGLPGMDGYEVAQRLRAVHPRATLVAVTGYGREADVRRSAEVGFARHLIKPLQPGTVLEVLDAVTASASAGGT